MIDKSNEFETHNIYLAAYLSYAGCKLERKRKDGRRVYFIFTNAAGSIAELRDEYFSGNAMVSACKYSQAIMSFKELCFDAVKDF